MDQKKGLRFLGYWVAGTIAILVGSWIFNGNIVLGNDKLSTPHAAILFGLILTILGALVPVVFKTRAAKVEVLGMKIKSDNYWTIVYFAANFVFIWVLKRFALQLGLGVSSILYVILLSILVSLGQWVVAKSTGQNQGES